MLEITLYTTHKLDSAAKAEDFLRLMITGGGPFSPIRFDDAEPIRKVLDIQNLQPAVNLLNRKPDYGFGDIFLRGKKFKSISWISWNDALKAQTWRFYLHLSFFRRRSAVSELLDFFKNLSGIAPILFAGAASDRDWHAKHYITAQEEGCETTRKVGIELASCLPGVYWLTVFGSQLTGFFGAEKLRGLPVEQTLELESGEIALALTADPLLEDELRRRERLVLNELGAERFFDIHNPEKRCSEIERLLSLGGCDNL
jgi:hypothetical protein